MLIISDTSPITNLIRIGQLDILKKLFKEVVIPQQVYEELLNYENQKSAIEQRTWIVMMKVKDREQVKELEIKLDAGEAEAIVLAHELKADMLIIDERKGRIIAEEYGLKIIGLLGVLLKAKREGYLKELKPIMDRLIDEIGFRVSTDLYDRILKEAKE